VIVVLNFIVSQTKEYPIDSSSVVLSRNKIL